MQRRHAIRPLLGNSQTVDPLDRVACPTRVVGTHLEACGKNNAIHLVLNPVEHHAFFGKRLDTSTLGVDQTSIEGL